jgi:molybdate transport system ATP-binding protein
MIDVDVQLDRGSFRLQADFEVPGKGVTGIFGASGSGKTTLLRAVAGLEEGARGQISLNDSVWLSRDADIPVHRRKVAYVFQEASLFPHLNVEGNLLFGRTRVNELVHQFDLEEVISLLGLKDLLHRDPESLSGGEKQRVAIGRALLSKPSLLLMDEPLSGLDHGSRKSLMLFLEKTIQSLEIPVLYVSHSSDEIARLAANLVLMKDGLVSAYGAIAEVLVQVDSPFATSEEAFTVLECRVGEGEDLHISHIHSRGGETLRISKVRHGVGMPVRLRIQARDVSLCLTRPLHSSILNILPATVRALSRQVENGHRTVKLDIAGDNVLARVSEYSCQQLTICPGLELFAQIKSAALVT